MVWPNGVPYIHTNLKRYSRSPEISNSPTKECAASVTQPPLLATEEVTLPAATPAAAIIAPVPNQKKIGAHHKHQLQHNGSNVQIVHEKEK